MSDLILAKGSYELIKKDLGLEDVFDFSEKGDPFEALHYFLTRQIAYLLDHDFGTLLNAMYRIDVAENRVKEILETSEPNEIAANFSIAIIERERQKMITRLKYST